MRVVFAGSGEFAVPVLAALANSSHELTLVLSQPDRPAGRGRRLRPTPVTRWARARELTILMPETLGTHEIHSRLREIGFDVLVVVAYGELVPPPLLTLPRYGALNVHPSLLPRWRGAAPVVRALAAGDRDTGVTVIKMDAGLDTGDVLRAKRESIHAGETAGELTERLANVGAGLLLDVLDQLPAGQLRAVPQSGGVTYAKRVTAAEAHLDFSAPASRLVRLVLAFNPRPGAWAVCDGERVRLLRARVMETERNQAPPGTVVASGPAGLAVATGRGLLCVIEAQRPGGKPLAAGTLSRARDWTGRRFQ